MVTAGAGGDAGAGAGAGAAAVGVLGLREAGQGRGERRRKQFIFFRGERKRGEEHLSENGQQDEWVRERKREEKRGGREQVIHPRADMEGSLTLALLCCNWG